MLVYYGKSKVRAQKDARAKNARSRVFNYSVMKAGKRGALKPGYYLVKERK